MAGIAGLTGGRWIGDNLGVWANGIQVARCWNEEDRNCPDYAQAQKNIAAISQVPSMVGRLQATRKFLAEKLAAMHPESTEVPAYMREIKALDDLLAAVAKEP